MGSFYTGLGIGTRVVNPDGTTNIRCRKCGRVIARARDSRITTVSECALCQGYPPESVLPQYIQLDPTKPPMPLIDPADEVMTLYEEEKLEAPLGKWGFLRPLFRAIGWIKPAPPPPPPSKAVAKRKKNKGLFEKVEE